MDFKELTQKQVSSPEKIPRCLLSRSNVKSNSECACWGHKKELVT